MSATHLVKPLPLDRRGTIDQAAFREQPGRPIRIASLDFTKGVLVLLMVFYHWVNYFVGLTWEGYRFIRFLTPAFICITGFIVTRVYLDRYAPNSPELPRRLGRRGVKLLLLFLALNIGVFVVLGDGAGLPWTDRDGVAQWAREVFLSGTGRAAFDILVPIAYFLLMAPIILRVSHLWRIPLWVMAGTVVIALSAIEGRVAINRHLEISSFALLGLAAGAPTLRQRLPARRWLWLLLAAYLAYLTALEIWNVRYPVQVAGVMVNLLAIYVIAMGLPVNGVFHRRLVRLGQYSLVAYIAQIVILQLLRRLSITELASGMIGALFLAAVGTVIAVDVVAGLRARSAHCDRVYRAIFA